MSNPQPIPVPAVEPSLLPGVNILLEGPGGTGKTHSIGTLVDTGIETFYLSTESGMEALFGYYTDRGKEIPANLHWHSIKRKKAGFGLLLSSAETINRSSFESLTKMADPKRHEQNDYLSFLTALTDFPDDRTGKKFGAVDSWGPDKVLVIDSMTGMNSIVMSMVVGNKPVRNQAEWGLAQDQLEKVLRQLTDGCQCHVVVIAHIERETDQIVGGVKITVSTLGKALAPKIPPMFSDVILAKREGTKWVWSTADALTDLKTRNLPVAEGIAPDFAQIMAKWQSRGGRFSPIVKV